MNEWDSVPLDEHPGRPRPGVIAEVAAILAMCLIFLAGVGVAVLIGGLLLG